MYLHIPLLAVLFVLSLGSSQPKLNNNTRASRPPPCTVPPVPRPPVVVNPSFVNHTPAALVPSKRISNDDLPKWSSCALNKCQMEFQSCNAFFNDGCLCLPGLIHCVDRKCATDGELLLKTCIDLQETNTRCSLSCWPSLYPNEPFPHHNNIPNDIEWKVLVEMNVESLSSKDAIEASYDLVVALISTLPSSCPVLSPDNATLVATDSKDINSTSVTISFWMESVIEMKQAQNCLETNVLLNRTALGDKLVENFILFHSSQVDVQRIKAQIVYSNEYLHSIKHDDSTTDDQIPQERLALSTGAILGILFGSAAGLSLLITMCCWWRRRNGAHSGYLLHGV